MDRWWAARADARLNTVSIRKPERAAGSHRRGRLWPRGPLGLALLALGLLLLGTLVYLLDRPAGSAWLVPPQWQQAAPKGWFGPVGPWLPSFVHAFAFSVLTALSLPRRPMALGGACVLWATIDSLAEVGQHPAFSGALAEALPRWLGNGPVVTRVGRYFDHGVFDVGDLVAGLAGAALAYLALRRALLRPAEPVSAQPRP
jgi:hypothetical protein